MDQYRCMYCCPPIMSSFWTSQSWQFTTLQAANLVKNRATQLTAACHVLTSAGGNVKKWKWSCWLPEMICIHPLMKRRRLMPLQLANQCKQPCDDDMPRSRVWHQHVIAHDRSVSFRVANDTQEKKCVTAALAKGLKCVNTFVAQSQKLHLLFITLPCP